ncbi:MAG: ATP synthase epsilon chain [Gemmatimonadota bacterium]|nr:MAG: ATP synthase epsilon chain [Gemmatimonadota bacterium]
MATLHCTVVTPERAIFEADADKITVPAWDGEIGILPRHARLLAKLGVGVLRITFQGKTEEMLVDGGFVQVADDKVTVLTDKATDLPDIDVKGAEKRLEELRGTGQGEEFAAAKHRLLTMKRVKDRFNRS